MYTISYKYFHSLNQLKVHFILIAQLFSGCSETSRLCVMPNKGNAVITGVFARTGAVCCCFFPKSSLLLQIEAYQIPSTLD